ncbi:MAG: hypothetical protein AAF125_26180, partial [Chloroflexota bacterium]
MRLRRHHIYGGVTAIIVITMIAAIIGQPSTARAQAIAGAVTPVAQPIAAPLGLVVNSLTGDLRFDQELIEVRGGDYPITFNVVYDTAFADEDIGYTPNWRTNHDTYYERLPSGDLRVNFGTGGGALFLPTGDGYRSLSGSGYRLLEPITDVFVLQDLANSINYYFEDPSHRKLTRRDAAGTQAHVYLYNESSQLTEIRNRFGGALTFDYATLGEITRLIRVTDAEANRTITLNYDDADQLTEIIDYAGARHAFTYSDGLLATYTNARGTTAEVSYTDRGVASILTPLTAMALDYNVGNRTTSVIERVNGQERTTTYSYNVDNQIAAITSPGECRSEFTWTAGGAIDT